MSGAVDSPGRSLAKAVTYRILGLGVTMLAAWMLTDQLRLAAAIGLVDTTLKLGAYYAHERLWNRIRFGRARGIDYEI